MQNRAIRTPKEQSKNKTIMVGTNKRSSSHLVSMPLNWKKAQYAE
jgi:hypothetical protein